MTVTDQELIAPILKFQPWAAVNRDEQNSLVHVKGLFSSQWMQIFNWWAQSRWTEKSNKQDFRSSFTQQRPDLYNPNGQTVKAGEHSTRIKIKSFLGYWWTQSRVQEHKSDTPSVPNLQSGMKRLPMRVEEAGIQAQALLLNKSRHQNALTTKEVVLLGLRCWGDCSLTSNVSNRKEGV